jgi:hypothetical protein
LSDCSALHEGIDLCDQFFDAAEKSAPDGALGDESEPPVDLV